MLGWWEKPMLLSQQTRKNIWLTGTQCWQFQYGLQVPCKNFIVEITDLPLLVCALQSPMLCWQHLEESNLDIPVRLPDKLKFDLNTGCIIYTGVLNSSGYGPHERIYRHFVGPVPAGKELDHLCKRRSCINFNHLEPVSRLVNVHRGKAFKATPEWWERIKIQYYGNWD